jgi:hypothetical protein
MVEPQSGMDHPTAVMEGNDPFDTSSPILINKNYMSLLRKTTKLAGGQGYTRSSNKYPKMHVLICNFHWIRSQKYTKNLQLHIRVLHACREYLLVHVSLPPSAPSLLLVCGTRVIACACVLLSVRGLQSVQWKLS